MRRRRRGFTLLEILAAMAVLAIVASLGMMSYRGYRDRVAMMVDETNEKILQMAVRLYAYDNNALPGSLSELRNEQLRKAYALVSEGAQPYTFLAFLQEWVGLREALADPLPPRYFNNDLKVLICPSDSTPPLSVADRARRSYEIDPNAACQSLAWLLDPDHSGLPLIYECEDDGTPSSGDCGGSQEARPRAYRHGGNDVCVTTTVGGNSRKEPNPSGQGGQRGRGGEHGRGGRGGDGSHAGDDDDD